MCRTSGTTGKNKPTQKALPGERRGLFLSDGETLGRRGGVQTLGVWRASRGCSGFSPGIWRTEKGAGDRIRHRKQRLTRRQEFSSIFRHNHDFLRATGNHWTFQKRTGILGSSSERYWRNCYEEKNPFVRFGIVYADIHDAEFVRTGRGGNDPLLACTGTYLYVSGFCGKPLCDGRTRHRRNTGHRCNRWLC